MPGLSRLHRETEGEAAYERINHHILFTCRIYAWFCSNGGEHKNDF